jgi:hypothetical protein
MRTPSLSLPAMWLGLERRARRALTGSELDRTCLLALGAAIAIYAAVAIYLMRGTTLFVDEVSLFLENRGLDPRTLLEPLNGHIIVFSRLVYAIGYDLVGPASAVYHVIEVVGAALAAGVLFVIVRRRVGAPLALAAAILLLFLGSAWEVILVPSGYPNVYSVTFGLGAWLALDRGDRHGDLAACALLVAAIAVSDISLAFLAGALVRVGIEGPRRRVWIPTVPLVLYGAWFAAVQVGTIPNGESSAQASNLLTAPNYLFDEASAVAGALAGLNYDFAAHEPFSEFSTSSPYGPPAAALITAGIVWVARRRSPSPRLWGALAMLAVLWLALALSFGLGRNPTTVRYAYPSAVLIFVVGAEAGAGQRVGMRVLVAAYGLLAFALGTNVVRLDHGARFFRDYATNQRAQLTAIEAAGAHVEPRFHVTQGLGVGSINAQRYLAAVRRNGSPAFSPSELEAQPETARAGADSTLVSALGIHLVAAPPGAARWSCRLLVTPGGGSATAVVQPSRTLVVRTSRARVALRRFASTTTVPVGTVSGAAKLRLPPDAYRGSWYVSVSRAGGRVSVCTRQR